MRVAFAGLACFLAELALPAVAAPAPDIVGKSVLMRWTEYWAVKIGGVLFPHGRLDYDLRIYISTAQRPFTRLTATSRLGSAKSEQVGGSGTSMGGGPRVVRIDGHTIVSQATWGNFARNLRVELTPGGGSCSAQMSVGREVGSAPKAFRVGDEIVEIFDVAAGSVSCEVQQGNVLAN